jgi:putative addiction module component (TIGR02574 family)
LKHQPISAPPGFAELSKAEQIDYVQALWDQIADEADDIPVLESHLTEVERRLAEHRLYPDDVLPAYEALDRLRQSLE